LHRKDENLIGSELATVAFGLASAACWGTGDFSGGLATKRTNVYAVIIASQIVGAVLLAMLALAFREPLPPPDQSLWGTLAGLAGAVGLIGLYRALALGRMGVAAPVSAVITASVPVVVGAFTEGMPDVPQQIGFGLALIGIWLVSRTEGLRVRIGDLGLPIMAGLSFGFFLVFIGQVSDGAVLWPLVAARTASLTLMIVTAALTRQPRLPEMKALPLIALAGAMDAGGNAFFALAAQAGRLDVASVLASLYPATTVWLAWLILKERIVRPQAFGIGVTLAAIALIVA
jgi:drug/metabolite transporter (DMT)-like permease